MACSMNLMATAPAAAAFSSSRSASFNNTRGLRGNSCAMTSSTSRAQSLSIRATRDTRNSENEKSVVEKLKDAAQDAAANIQDAIPGNKGAAASPGRKPGAGRQGQPEHKSSTGGITDAAKEMAEKTATVFDGVRENVMDKLQDDGRDLKSKTGDVTLGAHRNADGIPSDVVQKSNDAQTAYTKNVGKQ